MSKKKLTKEQEQEIVERFKNGETLINLAKKMGVSYVWASTVCKIALGETYKSILKTNRQYTSYNLTKMNNDFLKVAKLIVKGTTLNEIASETGNSMQYTRWWCKTKLNKKIYDQLIQNRRKERNDRKA